MNDQAQTPPTFVLYHAHCADGFGAALAAWLRMGDQAQYLPVCYGETLPEIPDGADVYILDFSYPRAVLVALEERCTVCVIDHHQTAAAELAGLPFATFDAGKSGAVLAWEEFHHSEVPELLLYVQDRDLWRWQLPHSQEVSAALQTLPRDFGAWHALIDGGSETIEQLVKAGRIALRVKSQLVAHLCDGAREGMIGGHFVPIVNSPVHQSEIGHELLVRHEQAPFAAIYFDREKSQRVWSLRSRADFDVSAVAKGFGGGGHAQAAGFEQPMLPPEINL